MGRASFRFTKRGPNWLRLIAVIVAMALVAGACGDTDSDGAGGQPPKDDDAAGQPLQENALGFVCYVADSGAAWCAEGAELLEEIESRSGPVSAYSEDVGAVATSLGLGESDLRRTALVACSNGAWGAIGLESASWEALDGHALTTLCRDALIESLKGFVLVDRGASEPPGGSPDLSLPDLGADFSKALSGYTCDGLEGSQPAPAAGILIPIAEGIAIGYTLSLLLREVFEEFDILQEPWTCCDPDPPLPGDQRDPRRLPVGGG
ncbi:MAG: hypothetical protein AAFZ07_19440 [Actinomycetota bacterium]